MNYRGKEHVVEVDQRLNVPSSVQSQTNGKHEDHVAQGQEQHTCQVDASRDSVGCVCASVAFIA